MLFLFSFPILYLEKYGYPWVVASEKTFHRIKASPWCDRHRHMFKIT